MPWTCPNTKCTYDKQLQRGQGCPLCGKQAKEFNFSELGNLWKLKWDYKKSIETAKRRKMVLGKIKYCPKCGSNNLNVLVFYRPSMWKCLECGYEGAFVIEDGKLAEKIRDKYRNCKGK